MVVSKYEQIKGEVKGAHWSKEQDFAQDDCITFETKEKKCKILQLTDIHLRQYTKGTFGTGLKIRKMIRKEKPDLVVVTGDFTALDDNDKDTKWLIKTLDGTKVPWTAVMGNHDSQGKYDRHYIANMIEKSRLGLFRQGPATIGGVGNFIIKLTCNGVLWGALILLDSHTSFEIDGLEYESLTKEQIEWYSWAIKGLNAEYSKAQDKIIPSLMFLHIPLNEFQQAWENGEIILGTMGEDKVYAPKHNSGMFEEILKLNSTKGVFAGHDHASSFCSKYKGVYLGYGTQTRFNKTGAERKFAASEIIMNEEGNLNLRQVSC